MLISKPALSFRSMFLPERIGLYGRAYQQENLRSAVQTSEQLHRISSKATSRPAGNREMSGFSHWLLQTFRTRTGFLYVDSDECCRYFLTLGDG